LGRAGAARLAPNEARENARTISDAGTTARARPSEGSRRTVSGMESGHGDDARSLTSVNSNSERRCGLAKHLENKVEKSQ
jgi:hypothetical protein